MDRMAPQLSAARRRLHARPDLSGAEQPTIAYLRSLLEPSGVMMTSLVGGRGLVVDSTTSDRNPFVALRADIDALGLHDAKDVPYRSQTDGVMHACGHDAHAAIAVAAMLALDELDRDNALPWPVHWRGILQPAEETAEGAREMVAAGAMKGVRALFALHADPSLPVGSIGVREGMLTAACDLVEIQITGKGGHAARPHQSIDPIPTAAQLITALYTFVPRASDAQEPVVLTIGQISSGYSPNVIPEGAILRGTLRSLGELARTRAKERVYEIAEGIAEAAGAQIEVSFGWALDSVLNDPALNMIVRRVACDLVGAENVHEIESASMGGEDFAGYLEHTPGTMFRLGIRSSQTGGEPLHSPLFDIDEAALPLGAKMLAAAVIEASEV